MKTARIRPASGFGLALAIVAFLALNLAAGLTLGSVRLDFTAGHIYTVSPVTADILGKLNEPIKLRFYVSPSLTEISGQYANYAAHVRELLDTYRRKSHGKITVEFISPEPFSAEEDRALSFGLHGVPVDAEGNQAYFGIVATNSTDQTQAIPFLTPEREVFLEYDLTKLVSTLANPKKQVIGLIDGAGTSGNGRTPAWLAIDQARQQFTVQTIATDTDHIDAAVSVLMIVHPKNLGPATSFAIDQFVLGGGHALVFVDPDAESVAAPTAEVMSTGLPGGGPSDMPALFKAWGIAYDPSKVVADWDQAMRIEASSFGRPVITEFPPYIAVKPPYLKTDDPVTGDLKAVNMITPGALLPAAGAQTSFTPLLQSSPHSRLVDAADASASVDALAFLAKYQPGDQTFTLAARIVGPATTAFPDGPPKEVAHPGKPGAYLKESAKPIDVIVATDIDMLSDHSWVEIRDLAGQKIAMPFASNGDFAVNALENLTGSPALSSLRGRGISSRPLSRVEDLQREADARYRATEESLSQKLEDARRKLLTLAPQKNDQAGGKPLLSDEQQEEIKHFHTEMSETRAELRDVQHDLRHDIDRLETRVKFLNIVIVPLAVVIFSLFLAFGCVRRRR